MKAMMKTTCMRSLMLGCAVVGAWAPLMAADHNENRESANEYNLYERNRDDRDFNNYDYPDQSGNSRGNSRRNSSYYQNNNNNGSYYYNDDSQSNYNQNGRI